LPVKKTNQPDCEEKEKDDEESNDQGAKDMKKDVEDEKKNKAQEGRQQENDQDKRPGEEIFYDVGHVFPFLLLSGQGFEDYWN
jgi:hypothetical protein